MSSKETSCSYDSIATSMYYVHHLACFAKIFSKEAKQACFVKQKDDPAYVTAEDMHFILCHDFVQL